MAKKKSYPANLLDALRVNRETHSNIQYDDLTDDQMKGLESVLSALSEREQIVIHHFYVEGMTRKAIAEKYNLTEYRIKQIIDHALRKFRLNREWLFYISNGYEANCEHLRQQRIQAEDEYRCAHGIKDHTHLYYQDISELHFPARIHNPLQKHGVKSVRDLVIFVCSSEKIRNFGELSAQTVSETLKNQKLLPEEWEYEVSGSINIPRLDIELRVFKALSKYK